jgi:ParG
MTRKKVTFGTKPQPEELPSDPDAWVSGSEPSDQQEPETKTNSTASTEIGVLAETEKMKRLTIDIPPTLHTRIKVECAQRQKKIADIVRQLLEQEFPVS